MKLYRWEFVGVFLDSPRCDQGMDIVMISFLGLRKVLRLSAKLLQCSKRCACYGWQLKKLKGRIKTWHTLQP